ncbi:MAG TPA: CHAT domain-containing protein [Draconibacterium sp.]|nr:CHAT domain-containing protein [Draconibacterium sp.]
MTILCKYRYLIIIILYPLFSQGQNQNFISDSIRAIDLNKKAIQLYQKGLHTQALDTFFESLQLRKKIYGSENYNLAAAYLGIGVIYKSLGQLDLAIQNYDLAEINYSLAKSYPYKQMVNLYVNIGTVYRSKLDYNRALQYFEQALAISQNEIKASPEEIAGINYNIAEIYYRLKNDDEAIKLINNNIHDANTEDQILFYELLAFIYQIKGDISKSKKNYQNAIELTISINEKNHINVAISYLNYTNLLILINQFTEAEETLKKSFDIMQLTNPINGQVLWKYYLFKGLLVNNQPVSTQNLDSFKKQKKQNLNEAIRLYKKGLEVLNFPENYTLGNSIDSERILSLVDCITLLKLVADGYNDLANLEQTKDNIVFSESMAQTIYNYQIVSSLIQQARKEISDDESKIQLTALEYATFYRIIQISHTAYSITKDPKYLELAFENAERIKSSSVFDKISNQLALENSLVPDSLLNMEQKLNNTITIFSEKLYEESSKSEPDSSLIKEYNNEIFEAQRDREELNRYLETEYKDFYNLKYSKSMFSVKDIQQKLKRDQIIIEYVLNENDTMTELYSFVISSDNIEFSKQKVNHDFLKSLETMFYFMSNSEYLFTKKEDSKQFCVASNQLYKNLILPFKNQIQNKKITIIPDGKLSYIPFDAFLENIPDTSKTIEFNQLSYLIRNYTINYSNSANLLFNQIPANKKTRINAIAFAPEYKEGDFIESANQKLTLIPLPGVQREVAQIAKIIKTQIFKGVDATENNFRANIENYDILHLAMHAFINDSLPAFSSLAFTQIETEDPTKNGLLNTTDIYNFKLNAQLTVLSACNTGTGQLKKGEGIMSLARGFLYAGCPSIIMSLWEVEDESGTQIMTSFYKNLKKGKTKDESLRLAKLEYLESVNSRRAHPHYWLGFVSIGDNSPLYISYDFYFFILLILALSGIGIDQGLRIKKARKKRAL